MAKQWSNAEGCSKGSELAFDCTPDDNYLQLRVHAEVSTLTIPQKAFNAQWFEGRMSIPLTKQGTEASRIRSLNAF